MGTTKPVILCILDGWGLRDEPEANAPKLAATPTFDRLMAECPHATLVTHGPDAGLPSGQMGNSEVGHTNIGAGRIVAMDLGQIDLAIEDGSFAKQKALQDFIDALKISGGTAHLVGLASPGGVHSHQNHLIAAAKVLDDAGVHVFVHAITDGRDVAPQSAVDQLKALSIALPSGVRVATVTGRYWAMDRDNRWDRVEKAYRAIVEGVGARTDNQAWEAVESSYENDVTDEFLPATVLGDFRGMKNGDGLFFVNFRADRARQILSAICDPSFDEFEREGRPELAACLGMVEYSEVHNEWMTAVFPKREIVNTLGAWVARHGLRQFRLAETEKYPHVTFFLNGGKEAAEEGEERCMPPSPKVATYDLKPEMSAPDVTHEFMAAIDARYDLIVVNYANPDMVGHTGDLNAAIAACEAVDHGLSMVVSKLEDVGGTMVLTADHGNCETMIDSSTGGPHTAHTTNLVPVILVGGPAGAQLRSGRLADLAPTVLSLMGLTKPAEMTGETLVSV
ncbi:MAG: 2,3-bisphosphoglycerate-independent phosphoglycerate mutase [Pseudomonadota bacterium]